jgi:signal transduction histidine kinase
VSVSLGLLFSTSEGLEATPCVALEPGTTPQRFETVTNLALVRQWLWPPAETNLVVDLEGVVAGIFPELSLVVLHDDTGNAGIKLDLERFSFLKTRQRIRIKGLAHLGKGQVSLLPMKLIDNDGLHGAQEASGRLYLTQGLHPFRLSYFQFIREQVLKVEYEGPDTSRRTLPREAFFHVANPDEEEMRCEPGLNFDYYEGFWDGVPDFRQLEPIKSGIAETIGLDLRRQDNDFAFRFAGLLKIEQPGKYVFYLISDDGSQLFLQEVPTSVEILSRNGSGPSEAAQPLDPGLPLSTGDDYMWSSVEGTVDFIGRTRRGWTWEISSAGAQMKVYLNNAASLPIGLVNNCRIRATGFCEGILDKQCRRVPGTLLVSGTNDISFLEAVSGARSATTGATVSLPVLTTAEQIRQLKPDEAARARPVRLRGIITARRVMPAEGILQDHTSAVYVRFHLPDSQQPTVGSCYELTGVTAPGGFATLVVADKAIDLGTAQFPTPLHPDYAQLLGGSMDCQWVELQGMVSRVELDTRALHLTVKGGEVSALFIVNSNLKLIEGLSNAFVRVRGCVIPGRNQSGQSTEEVYLWVPSLACLAVDRSPQADPFVAPLKQVAELSLFDPNPNYYQTIRVRGQVLHVADNLVYFSDGTNSLRIIPKNPPRVSAGDLVDAVGLPELGFASPALIEAVIRKTGHASLPEPPSVDFDRIAQPDYDAHWVSMKGRLIEIHTDLNRVVLELQSGLRTIQAVGPANVLATELPSPGSLLTLRGVVAQARRGNPGNPGAAELQFNSLSDVTCLALPPFWTLKRTLLAFAVLILTILLAGLWIHCLRRTVATRTRTLRLEMTERQSAEEKVRALQTARALEEQRTRIARNIHDDLGARVTKLNLIASQIPVSATDFQTHLDNIASTSRQMIEALDETVWAVNPANDSLLRLANYVMYYAQDFFHDTSILCHLDIPIDLPELPVTAEFRFNLFLVVKEAFNNALKHSAAHTVLLQMRISSGQLQLNIQDDGRGFDPDSVARRSGLVNLQSRVAGLGGQAAFVSAPGRGARISVTVPLLAPAVQPAG